MLAQARWNPKMERGGEHEVPPLTEEILMTDSCLERPFSLSIYVLLDRAHSSERLQVQEYIGNVNWTTYI